MFKTLLTALLAGFTLIPAAANAGAALTELEMRWLNAAAPVLAYSQRINLPIDITVQPKARPGDVPLAMGFVDGRCKLVLSMRGNPDAETILNTVPEAERALLIETMAAHEIGHCWRYVQGVWHALPAGFVETGDEQAQDGHLLAASKAMREMRREEGFADLVALSWVQRQHPAEYGRVYAWLSTLRDAVPVEHSGHDTRTWVRLAKNADSFGRGASPFDDAVGIWQAGLLNDE
jgi:ADP-ribose pyrophosphatase YjhB (NUDIX family)